VENLKLNDLLNQGELLLKARLEAEFLMIPKVYVKLNVETSTVYSYIRFSKKHCWGASMVFSKDCTPEILNSMVDETIDAYKHSIYEYLTKEGENNG